MPLWLWFQLLLKRVNYTEVTYLTLSSLFQKLITDFLSLCGASPHGCQVAVIEGGAAGLP